MALAVVMAVAFAGLVLALVLAASFVVLVAVPPPLHAVDARQGGTRHGRNHQRDREEKECLGEVRAIISDSQFFAVELEWQDHPKIRRRVGRRDLRVNCTRGRIVNQIGAAIHGTHWRVEDAGQTRGTRALSGWLSNLLVTQPHATTLAKLFPFTRKTGGTMITKLLRTLVGLSIAAIGTLVPTSASATTVWRNFAANEAFCLGNTSGNKPTKGSDLWVWTCNGTLAQSWDEPTYTPDPSYDWIVNSASVNPNSPSLNLCASANSANNGAAVSLDYCGWFTAQGWKAVYSFNDQNNHPCYYWQSDLADAHLATRVLGVSGGNVANGTHVILWDFLSTHADQYWCAY